MNTKILAIIIALLLPIYAFGSDSNCDGHSHSSHDFTPNYTGDTDSGDSKTISCGVCSGSGYRLCYACGSTGRFALTQYLPYPPFTPYTQYVPCSACSGQGKSQCLYCGGDGQVTIEVSRPSGNYNGGGGYNNYNSGGYNSGGYNSGGYNNYNSNSSSSSGSSSTYTTCTICRGSGVCTSCNGKRGYWQSTGLYTGSDSKSWVDCPSCRGNGRCFNCFGSGRY